MAQRSSGNEHLYKEIVTELVKSFSYLAELVISHKFAIDNALNIKKLMDKDLVRYNSEMADLNTGIALYNSGIENVVHFIRTHELGELEDIALYLEKCMIQDFSDRMLSGNWSSTGDVKRFQKSLSLDNISHMLTEITNIAYNDHNPDFLRHFTKSSLVS